MPIFRRPRPLPADDFAATFDAVLATAQPSADDRHLFGDAAAFSRFVGWLADRGDYVFHGSKRSGITEFRTSRESGDDNEFGRQQAVFATPDPFWALFYAIVDRSNVRSINNSSIALWPTARRRHYKLNAVLKDTAAPAVSAGWLYVLPTATFVAQPRVQGVDTGQWASLVPVQPVCAIAVEPADYALTTSIKSVVGKSPRGAL